MLIGNGEGAAERVIIALDVPGRDEALSLIEELGDLVSFYKIGLQLFTAEGMPLVREVLGAGKRVFLDLKMDDVDETIASAVRIVARERIEFLTLQGGAATVRAAVKGRGSDAHPRILSVTLLSSMNEDDLADLKLVGADGRFPTLTDYVVWRAEQAVAAGADGLIASGDSIAHVRERVGPRPVIVSPGIRPGGASTHEHKRPATPAAAIRAGADYLVVGRPVREAVDKRGVMSSIIDEVSATVG